VTSLAVIEEAARETAAKVVKTGGKSKNFESRAVEALAETGLAEAIDPSALLPALLAAPASLANSQVASDFSDLQLILHADAEVEVQLLYWLTATTSVHNHGFDGAFRVLSGRSIHSCFTFDSVWSDDQGFALGSLSLAGAELLEPGDVRPIRGGFETIHAVYHLGFPSVTLLVATARSQPKAPTFEFRGRSIAVDRSRIDLFTIRQVQALRLMARTGRPFADQLAQWALERGPAAAYWALRGLDADIARLPVEALRSLEGALSADPDFARVLDAVRREKILARLVNLRASVADETARLLLALFMNVPDPVAWGPVLRGFFGGAPDAAARVGHGLRVIFEDPAWATVSAEASRADFAATLARVLAAQLAGAPAGGELAALAAHPLAEFIGLTATRPNALLGKAA